MELLNGKYIVENDNVCFTLQSQTEWVATADDNRHNKYKKGDVVKGYFSTYHSDFKGVLLKILDNEGRNCPDAETLLKRYESVAKMIKERF